MHLEQGGAPRRTHDARDGSRARGEQKGQRMGGPTIGFSRLRQEVFVPAARVIARGARVGRLATALVLVAVAVAAAQVWRAERQTAALRDEVAWLHTRLGDERELINRQRREMAQVAGAVDRLARTTAALGERGAEARRLAHMAESRVETPALVNVAARLDGGGSVVSEDAGRALEELAWGDGQGAVASDSFRGLTGLLKDRREDGSRGGPTPWPVPGPVTSPLGARPAPQCR